MGFRPSPPIVEKALAPYIGAVKWCETAFLALSVPWVVEGENNALKMTCFWLVNHND
jgi:hypothetical protein